MVWADGKRGNMLVSGSLDVRDLVHYAPSVIALAILTREALIEKAVRAFAQGAKAVLWHAGGIYEDVCRLRSRCAAARRRAEEEICKAKRKYRGKDTRP